MRKIKLLIDHPSKRIIYTFKRKWALSALLEMKSEMCSALAKNSIRIELILRMLQIDKLASNSQI